MRVMFDEAFKRAPHALSTVYFIQVGDDGCFKIGSSARPSHRLTALQTSHYEPLNLRAVVHSEDERLVHRRFKRLRVRGEWFKNEEPLHSFIQSLPSETKAFIPSPWPYRYSRQTMLYFWCHEEITDEEAAERMEVTVRTLYRLFGPSGRPSGWKRKDD